MSYDLYSQIETFSTKLTMNTISFLMKAGEVKRIPKGQVISKEGDDSEHVYIVIDGVARIEKTDRLGNQTRIASVESGGLIGEMGVFLDMKRSATVVAASDMTLVEFTNEKFVNALPKTPDLTVRLLKSLTDKINLANQRYADTALKNHMLIVGMHIIDEANEKGEVHLDAGQLFKDTRLDRLKLVSALANFRKQNLISKWRFEEDGLSVEFKTKVADLKRYMKRLT